MNLNYYDVQNVKRDFESITVALEKNCPQALMDPVIATAAAQIKVAELALVARLDQLMDGDDNEAYV